MTARWKTWWLVPALMVGAGLAATAEPAVEVSLRSSGHVDVVAVGAPLERVFERLSAILPLDTSRLDASVNGLVVTVTVRDAPLDEALARVLRLAGLSFSLWTIDPAGLAVMAFPLGTPGRVPARSPAKAPDPRVTSDPAVAEAVRLGISPDDPDLGMVGTGPKLR